MSLLTIQSPNLPRCAVARGVCVAGLMALTLSLCACKTPPKSPKQTEAETTPPAQSAPPPASTGRATEPDIAADIITAENAAKALASLPAVEDRWTLREIALHGALYREAYAGIVADNTDYVLLQPMPADELPDLAVSDREFYLRVLAGCAALSRPAAWTTIEQPASGQSEFFPGSRHLATRLSFEILKRDDESATVIANVSDRTAHTGSSRQRVTATFDGRNWQTTRSGPRLIW